MKRRTLISLAAGGALAAFTPVWAAKKAKTARRPLRILILGGTRFIGLHMTAYALERGHTLTFFNRGKTKTDRYPEVERIQGDRNGQIDGLRDREWDVVIDNSGYVPRHVRASAELLAPKVKQYVFVSSISVYPNFSVPRDEQSEVGKLADESVEKVDGETYGPLKALCEQAVLKVYGDRGTVIRPGLIAPGSPADPFQIIDARDLAAFTINAVENGHAGTYNLVSNVNGFKFGELTDACVASARKRVKPADAPRAVYLPAEFLEEQKVEPWSEMPVWLPAKGDEAAFAGTSNAAALAKGLTIRPLAKTVDDTLAWHLTRPEAERAKLKSGIAAEKEATVLAAWKARKA
jgi:2'-hydroxyisoflavone reductase